MGLSTCHAWQQQPGRVRWTLGLAVGVGSGPPTPQVPLCPVTLLPLTAPLLSQLLVQQVLLAKEGTDLFSEIWGLFSSSASLWGLSHAWLSTYCHHVSFVGLQNRSIPEEGNAYHDSF